MNDLDSHKSIKGLDPKAQLLIKKLLESGWDFGSILDVKLEWWAADVFEFKSIWKPIGAKFYVYLLVDPMWGDGWNVKIKGQRKPNEFKRILSFGISGELRKETTRMTFTWFDEIYFKELNAKRIKEIVSNIERLRESNDEIGQ